jgi:hypothetical protein
MSFRWEVVTDAGERICFRMNDEWRYILHSALRAS